MPTSKETEAKNNFIVSETKYCSSRSIESSERQTERATCMFATRTRILVVGYWKRTRMNILVMFNVKVDLYDQYKAMRYISYTTRYSYTCSGTLSSDTLEVINVKSTPFEFGRSNTMSGMIVIGKYSNNF